MECGWDVCVAVCALVWGGNPMGEPSNEGKVVFPVSPVVWRVRLCRWFLTGRIFDHGGVRAGCVCPACQMVWCVGPVWSVSVGWSADVRPDVVLMAHSEDLFVQVSFCCKRCRFFHRVRKSGGWQTMYVWYFSTFASGGVRCNVKSGRRHFDTPGCGGCSGLWSLH